ncbi:putative transporter [Trachipleistophora hominis]|uniref:Putative transporter n=1 Tax=Trachipleistophora hominis TaxID=72359 RepID=L7JYG7_TRAHO|nr:putative transporter [Trachipleistophora hominis]
MITHCTITTNIFTLALNVYQLYVLLTKTYYYSFVMTPRMKACALMHGCYNLVAAAYSFGSLVMVCYDGLSFLRYLGEYVQMMVVLLVAEVGKEKRMKYDGDMKRGDWVKEGMKRGEWVKGLEGKGYFKEGLEGKNYLREGLEGINIREGMKRGDCFKGPEGENYLKEGLEGKDCFREGLEGKDYLREGLEGTNLKEDMKRSRRNENVIEQERLKKSLEQEINGEHELSHKNLEGQDHNEEERYDDILERAIAPYSTNGVEQLRTDRINDLHGVTTKPARKDARPSSGPPVVPLTMTITTSLLLCIASIYFRDMPTLHDVFFSALITCNLVVILVLNCVYRAGATNALCNVLLIIAELLSIFVQVKVLRKSIFYDLLSCVNVFAMVALFRSVDGALFDRPGTVPFYTALMPENYDEEFCKKVHR